METRTSVRRLIVSISPPVVTQTISANGCVIAPATRLILSLLISPDGVIIPLSSRVFFIGFSFSSMVPVVPKWCPDVKNKIVKRKTATITRYKKSLCLQGFSQITYKKICGNTGRFWLFHDPRNAVVRKGTWVRIPPLPPSKKSVIKLIAGFLLFLNGLSGSFPFSLPEQTRFFVLQPRCA